MHEDAEFVGFPAQHFHINWGFAPDRLWKYFGHNRYEGHHFAWPVQCPDGHDKRVILEGPALKLRKYKRDPGRFPVEAAARRWLPRLQEAFACAKLANGVCPHRGIPVAAMHRQGNVLTCPGHGLSWNAITGELVRGQANG